MSWPWNFFHAFCSSPGNEAIVQQVVPDDTVVLRQAPPPPMNRHNLPPENFDTARFEIFRDDNEFLIFDPPFPANDDFTFEKIHEEFGRPILKAMDERRALKESAEKPLIIFWIKRMNARNIIFNGILQFESRSTSLRSQEIRCSRDL